MREVSVLCDVLGMIDLALWESYCLVLGFRSFDDEPRGGKLIPVETMSPSLVFLRSVGVHP